jgi:hypothetical protein
VNFTPLIALPALVSLMVIWLSSVEKAVLWVYLPILLLLPNYFYFGTPPLNFAEYAIIPIGIAICWRAFNGKWKWSLLDALVGAYVLWNFISDLHAIGYTDMFQRIASPAALVVFPYMLGKMIIEQQGFRVAFLRRFVFCLFLDCIIATYEVRMGLNPARTFLIQFFPTSLWPSQLREGLVRAAGPFGHAILMGTVLGIAIILHRYVTHLGLWEPRFRFLPNLPLSKERLMLIVLVAGTAMTQSRGPWIATMVGAVLAYCGTTPRYKRAMKRAAAVLLIGGFFSYLVAKEYLSQSYEDVIARGQIIVSEEQRSAAYRADLVNRYQQIALRESFWGWGTSTWPKLPAMKSVDNAYLLITLQYGFTGLILYTIMLGASLVRLLRRALSSRELAPNERALMFALFGIGVSIAISTAMVFLGEQLYVLLFLFLGWGEGCLLSDSLKRPALDEPVILDWQPKFQFRGVIS